MKQSIYNVVRKLNKRFTNKILIHISGKRFGHFAILTHVGRKSGKRYQVPIIAEPFPGGFVVALTYGRKVDWLANLLHNGCCELRWKEQDLRLVKPEVIGKEAGLAAFPALLRSMLRLAGIQEFVRLTREE